MTPEELSTGPVLEWTEIDPGFADLFSLESLDHGRVLARAWAIGDELSIHGERAVYTDDGTDWTELPLPEGIVVRGIDNLDDRWVAYGWTYASEVPRELVDRVFLSDDQGASWTELSLDIPADSAVPSDCDRHLFVQSASMSAFDDGVVVDLWGYRVSDEPSERCPEVAPMRLLWSDGSTVELVAGPDPYVDALAFDAYLVDGGFAVSAANDVLSVHRVEHDERVSTTAAFEGLFPTWTLAAGSAGVAATAFPSLGGQLEASTIGGLPVWRDFDRISQPTDVPLWLGWSADGIDWGWQSLPDAFGITEGEPWAQLAVGRDFVIARVDTVIAPTPEEMASWRANSCAEDPCSGDTCSNDESLYGEAPPLRWFIARVP